MKLSEYENAYAQELIEMHDLRLREELLKEGAISNANNPDMEAFIERMHYGWSKLSAISDTHQNLRSGKRPATWHGSLCSMPSANRY